MHYSCVMRKVKNYELYFNVKMKKEDLCKSERNWKIMRCSGKMNGIKKEVRKITIDSNLKKLREENNMSQEMLARKLHIKRQTVSSYETGRSLPDIFILIKIADIFGITLDELVGRNMK